MAFRNMIKRILVNENPVSLPEQARAEDIIRSAGKDPFKNDLVLANPDGTVDLLPKKGLIRLRENSQFETQLSSKNGH